MTKDERYNMLFKLLDDHKYLNAEDKSKIWHIANRGYDGAELDFKGTSFEDKWCDLLKTLTQSSILASRYKREEVDMSKYRSGGVTIPDHRLGSYIYESESQKVIQEKLDNEVNHSIVEKLTNVHYNIPLNHVFLKSIHKQCFPIVIEKRVRDVNYKIVLCEDYWVTLIIYGHRFIFSNQDYVTLDKLEYVAGLVIEGKVPNSFRNINNVLKNGYVEPKTKFTEQEINQAYSEVKEQVADKEYMDVLEYCKLYGRKEEYSKYTYIIPYRSKLKMFPCRVEVYENYWQVKGHYHIKTLKQLIDHLDSWF